MKTVVSIRLSKELAERLDNFAGEMVQSRSSIIQRALEDYLEEYADLRTALNRLCDKNDPLFSGEDLMHLV